MSLVTNVILTAHVGLTDGSDPEIDSVNKFLRETEDGHGQFVEVSENAGGTKHMECRVYLAAFNYAETEVILRAVDQAPWRDKEMVQVSSRNKTKMFFGSGMSAAQELDEEQPWPVLDSCGHPRSA